jgi:F-type H+-transporting ATPase subunit delta
MFRGASAEALATLSGKLDEALGGADAGNIGRDLFAVSGVLRAEPSLRRVATDVSVQPEAKASLLREILSGKVDAAVVDLTATAAAQRWTRSRDLADVLEHLGVVATVKSAGDESGRLADEVFTLGQVVNDNPDLRDALSDPARSAGDKRSLVRSLLDGKALPATIALAEQALAGTYRTVGVALHEYQQVAAEVYGQGVATVRVARPLSDADRQRLTDALTRQYGREVHLNVVLDPEVVGGIRVEIGDDVIDGTISSRLDDARRKLAV